MAAYTGHVMNLANSIIGVSLLAMPFCFKQCGITLGIVMLILSSIISRLACHFLVKSSTMCRRRNFEFLAFYTFGSSGKLLVELGIIGFMMGTCVAFFVVMGDLGPAIISKIFNINNNSTLRTIVLLSLGILVVLPLGLLRNVASLAAISTATIGFYFLFIIKVFFESSPHLIAGDWWYHVNFWQPEGVLQCLPIFAMALSCQTQLFEIYDSLPTPTIEKMNYVVRSALNLCTIVYASVGFLGYVAYCKGNFTGNILLSFTPSLSSEMFKLGFVLSIAVSFPLVIFPCRASLYSLIFRRMPIHHELSQTSSHIPDSRFKCLTVAIVTVALVIGLLIPSIELVLGFLGSTIGIAICVIFPSLSFLNLNNKNTNERLTAKITLCIGVIIMIMGIFGNLFAAVENKPVEVPIPKIEDSKSLPQLKVPLKIEVSTEAVKKQVQGIQLINPVPPEKLLPVKFPNPVKPKPLKVVENLRKESPAPPPPALPPVPVIQPKNSESKDNKKEVETAPIRSEPKVEYPESKGNEVINKDAIEKEEREIKEVEKQKKSEEEQKQQELLKILKEHQDEQKKLLQEQEKILSEIKHRESEKKMTEVLKEQPKNLNLPMEVAKTVKPIESKNQTLTGSLLEAKNDLGKEKAIGGVVQSQNANVSYDSSKPRESLPVPEGPKPEEKESLIKNPVMPLPLAKLQVQPDLKKPETNNELSKSKQEILSRDILVEKKMEKPLERGKREAGEGETEAKGDVGRPEVAECDAGADKNSEKRKDLDSKLVNKTEVRVEKPKEGAKVGDVESGNIIKNSEHLSVGLSDNRKSEMGEMDTSKMVPDVLSQPFIPKKRDLKSINK